VYPAGCNGIPGADRQWLAVYDPSPGTPDQSAYTGPRPLIYIEYNNITTGGEWVKSNAGVDPLPGGPGLTCVEAVNGGPGTVTGTAPGITQVKATPHPMHFDDICLAGSGCITSQGHRNLADFFAVRVDHDGVALIVYGDTSNGLVQPGFTPDNQQLIDHAGAPLVSVLRQTSGPGVFGGNVAGPSNAPQPSLSDAAGDALFPVIGGTNGPGLDILDTRVSVATGTLTVSSHVADLSQPSATLARIPGATQLQYLTRWQMGNTLYFAQMETDATGLPNFFAGKTRSVDLCSVSACFPHVLTYPEPAFGGTAETGSVTCPAAPSATNPCTLTIRVNAADVGSPTGADLLEEVGTYALASTLRRGEITNANALADNVPIEIDGVCCFNFAPSPAVR
jgi:hypothetical protein